MKIFYKFLFILLSLLILSLVYIHYPSTTKDDITIQRKEAPITKDIIETNLPRIDEGDCVEEAINKETNANQNGWVLIWQDEFENNCLDSSKWNVEDWAAEKNNELQYYSPKNVKVEDGVLKLISKKEQFKGKDYTSGAVYTQGKFDFLYGKAEMRAKLPAGQGMFPAFWMMTDKENTWLPEIDIMEMLGHLPDQVWMVSHWLGEDGKLKSVSDTFKGPDFTKDFHTFGIVWTPDSITWFIDDLERFTISKNIPSESMYLYLNTAVGGNWPGSPDQATVFPVSFEIDYVRVYKGNGE
ncbi:glycoside hydrolase family 16 protein [Neobacillus sp. YX16]|uniref:glycoside hydrolase family 16 protein n=1 Tax=Neobacillus sp. YX16 TaxID=3047874 RepID=UPI0024C376A8|nr:glycoside hydrolase family 16 protein [Neobacillus sp. YX16]WHZ02810.1 glycoside hydrolase family 16 protein [Neobacillus sp. YX16]